LNYGGYCNPEVDRLIEQQSIEGYLEKRKQLVWKIERILAGDVAPHHLLQSEHHLLAALSEGLTIMVNSVSNGARMEDLWLDK
jgi:peptide/nickel transport system substrate-binding protein